MKKQHYVFLMGGSLVGHGNYYTRAKALERAKELSLELTGLVGAYQMIGSSESE